LFELKKKIEKLKLILILKIKRKFRKNARRRRRRRGEHRRVGLKSRDLRGSASSGASYFYLFILKNLVFRI
jgi:hypothetical protein